MIVYKSHAGASKDMYDVVPPGNLQDTGGEQKWACCSRRCVAITTMLLAAILTILVIGSGIALTVKYWHPVKNDIAEIQNDVKTIEREIDDISNLNDQVTQMIHTVNAVVSQATQEIATANQTVALILQALCKVPDIGPPC